MPIVEIFFFAVLIIAALFWSAITRNQHLKDEKLDEAVKAELPGGFLYYVIFLAIVIYVQSRLGC